MSTVLSNIREGLLNEDTKPLWDFLNTGGEIEELGKIRTPFYAYGTTCRDLALLELLFERGMNLDEDYCFFIAQKFMSDETFEWALEKNMDKAKTRTPVLFYLVGHPQRFKRIVERGADIHAPLSEYSPKHLIMHAVDGGNKETVNFLVENGADVNFCYGDGWTPFLTACISSLCGVDMLEHLVKLGADYRKRYKSQTAIMIVAGYLFPISTRSVEKLAYLMSLYQGWADEVDEKGNTALHLASNKGGDQAEVIAFLLSKGFNPMLANDNGRNPIEMCMFETDTAAFAPFLKTIDADPARFKDLYLQALCDKNPHAGKIREMINEAK